MKNKFSICYIIIDKNEGESFFLRSSNHLIKLSPVLERINNLPISIPELLCEKEEKIKIRVSSIYPGRVIHFIEDYNEIESLPYIFKVVFIDKKFTSTAQERDDILYISINQDIEIENILFHEELTIDVLRDFFFSRIKEQDPVYADLPDTYKNEQIETDINIDENIFTACNIKTLESINLFSNPKFTYDRDRNKNIETSINLINIIKDKITKNMHIELSIPSADYLITDFTIDLEYSINVKKYSKHTLMRKKTIDYELIYGSISYAKTTTEIDSQHNNNYITKYKDELYFNSLTSSIYASSTLTPEIKIRICNNDLFNLTSDIGKNIRNKNTSKIQKMMKTFSSIVIDKSDTMFDYFSETSNKQIKIISNFPLEWTNINGLPLMIRHNTSRIFNTPGFIKQNILLNNNEVSMSLDSFKKILVISSFKTGERISNDIKNELHRVLKECNDPSINSVVNKKVSSKGAYVPNFEMEVIFKDVTNKNELVDALNSFKFALVIFDMHGGHDCDGHGFLELSGEILYPYELMGLANIPPIVVLSACDTSPADRNHFNAANAFLCAGAKTVLASTYPILSIDAAIYIGRLYKRLRYYLPERILSEKKSLRWSEFITGLNRRVYFDYFLMYIFRKYKINDNSILIELRNYINIALENHPHDFLDGVYYFYENLTGLSRNQISDELNNHFLFAECLNYVQIGSPEKVLISAEDISIE
ncbi:CHAT domain-containing protein [Pectobacterium aquaticum]|uniref:CHAT domain-containing protein n=1 Tax=Pectobacterium aquaticum TaxID=2204145 RepID=UPI000E254B70|nr:CHAT domain-containing protein [Pectobacterium aquaticum]RRO08404.1 CHAT domain-containing protein [Pectobacterium aquaticum]